LITIRSLERVDVPASMTWTRMMEPDEDGWQ
jgi:hypothetical protein